MDIRMPLMDGEEAATRIRAEEKNGSHICIIALTAHSLKGDRERLLSANFDGYLSKPLDVTKIHYPANWNRVLAMQVPIRLPVRA
jgi:CheY-like chemotaxis protein